MNSFFLSLVLVGSPLFSLGQDPSLEQMLRLKVGNYWLYRGYVRWTAVGTNATEKKLITWKSEIMEETVHGPLKAYRVHGSVADLAWYKPDKGTGDYLWIIYQGRFYELALQPSLLDRFHDSRDSLLDVIDAIEPIIELPIRLGKCTTALHSEQKRERTDLLYCWYVESRHQRLLHIKGVTGRTFKQWRLAYQTMPDDEARSIVAGVGFTSFVYNHHGTVSEADIKLAEARLK